MTSPVTLTVYTWKDWHYISVFILKNYGLWEIILMMLFSRKASFPFSLQEENRPVGGFSLRGCLVSALEDNGVPAGKHEPLHVLARIVTP